MDTEKAVIVYGSKYGSSKSYAEELSRLTNIKFLSYKKIKDLGQYDTVIYIGSMYAGGILGLSDTIKTLNNKNILIVSVVLADTSLESNIENINKSLLKQVPRAIYDKSKKFYLRGSIDYDKLGFIDKSLMKMLYRRSSKLKEENRTPEMKVILETYNKKVNFIDYSKLEDIVEYLSSL